MSFIISNSLSHEDFVGYLRLVIFGLYLWWLKNYVKAIFLNQKENKI